LFVKSQSDSSSSSDSSSGSDSSDSDSDSDDDDAADKSKAAAAEQAKKDEAKKEKAKKEEAKKEDSDSSDGSSSDSSSGSDSDSDDEDKKEEESKPAAPVGDDLERPVFEYLQGRKLAAAAGAMLKDLGKDGAAELQGSAAASLTDLVAAGESDGSAGAKRGRDDAGAAFGGAKRPRTDFGTPTAGGGGGDGDSANMVHARGFPYEMTDDDIKQWFATSGEVVSIEVPKFEDSGRGMGMATVEFKTEAEA